MQNNKGHENKHEAMLKYLFYMDAHVCKSVMQRNQNSEDHGVIWERILGTTLLKANLLIIF